MTDFVNNLHIYLNVNCQLYNKSRNSFYEYFIYDLTFIFVMGGVGGKTWNKEKRTLCVDFDLKTVFDKRFRTLCSHYH